MDMSILLSVCHVFNFLPSASWSEGYAAHTAFSAIYHLHTCPTFTFYSVEQPGLGAMAQRLPTQAAMAQQLPLQVCSRGRDEGAASVVSHIAPSSYGVSFSFSTACLSHRLMGCSDQLLQVIEYLAKRGYNRTEAMLRTESAFADQDGHVVPQRAEHAGGRKYRLAMGKYIYAPSLAGQH